MCKQNNCKCKSLGLPCTELCGCVSCFNKILDDDDESDDDEEVSTNDSDSESDFCDSDDNIIL